MIFFVFKIMIFFVFIIIAIFKFLGDFLIFNFIIQKNYDTIYKKIINGLDFGLEVVLLKFKTRIL